MVNFLSISYWRFDLLESVLSRIAKSLIPCLTWVLKMQCLILLKLTPSLVLSRSTYIFVIFSLVVSSLLSFGCRCAFKWCLLYVICVSRSSLLESFAVPYSICYQVQMPFGLHCLTSVRDRGNSLSWLDFGVTLAWPLWEYIKLPWVRSFPINWEKLLCILFGNFSYMS